MGNPTAMSPKEKLVNNNANEAAIWGGGVNRRENKDWNQSKP